MILTLPLINHFSALTQSGILALLIVFSYLHKGARYITAGLILTLIGFKALLSIARWAYIIFKWIAMLGFYIHYFQVGIGFITTGVGAAIVFGEGLLKELESQHEERVRRREEEAREREMEREQNGKKKRARRK